MKKPTIWALLTPRVDPRDGYRLGNTYPDPGTAEENRKSWEAVVRYVPSCAAPTKKSKARRAEVTQSKDKFAWFKGKLDKDLLREVMKPKSKKGTR